ncbi:MAG: elongation factor P 5-aminopentanone reductase [Bacillus sp. (in: firmicutes)]
MKEFILVTGASGAIGKAIAKELAAQGHSLYLHYHKNQAAIEQLMEEINDSRIELHPVQADLSSEDGADLLADQIFSLNGIILNSGRAHYGLISDVSDQDLNEMMTLHLGSPFKLVRNLLPKLLQCGSASVVAVTSIWGDTGAACEVLYSMLKGGQKTFVKALGKELAPMNIRVNAVSPGAVDTPMLTQFSPDEKEALCEDIPLGRLGTPEEIANAVAFLLSNKSAYITGHTLKVNGGWYI